MAEKLWATLSNEWAEAAATAGEYVVAVQGGRRHSSGMHWSDDVIVTVNHGLRRDEETATILAAEGEIPARVIGRDAGTDLAVLRLQRSMKAPSVTWGHPDQLRIGDLVLALTRTRRGNIVASSGIVSGLMGAWRTWHGGRLDQFIRPDLTLYPGFSGGPLVNAQGKIVGLNTMGLHRSGVTVPAATLRRVVPQLLEKGAIERPYLGLAFQPVSIPEPFRASLDLKGTEGLLITHVEPASAAENSGVLLGDLLVELDGQSSVSTELLQEALSERKAGDSMRIKLVRAGKMIEAIVVLQLRPPR
jgi:S1-C subfamily serine protease